ncbi:hypothetical protein O0L34_g5800 [Tuta absoluta]|nr:hypothetical protein O0L34_g5800 [Tuta absoluta]
MPNLRSEADTTQNIATAVHRAQCTENKSIKSYKPSDDFTVQTRMSESMTTSQTPKSTPVKADSFRGVENKPRGSSAGSKSRLDTARSDVGRLSQRSTSKIKVGAI